MATLRHMLRLSRCRSANRILYQSLAQRAESTTVTKPTDVSGTAVEVEVSRDPEEFKWVERLLQKQITPAPPKHESYPTPSGWFPQTAKYTDNPYFVKRTRYHQHPIYLDIVEGGMRRITVLRYVMGDIWKFEQDLKAYLQQQTDAIIHTQVDEYTCKVRVRGEYMDEVSQFLKLKGF